MICFCVLTKLGSLVTYIWLPVLVNCNTKPVSGHICIILQQDLELLLHYSTDTWSKLGTFSSLTQEYRFWSLTGAAMHCTRSMWDFRCANISFVACQCSCKHMSQLQEIVSACPELSFSIVHRDIP